MAIHTDLLSVATDYVQNMLRPFKAAIGGRMRDGDREAWLPYSQIEDGLETLEIGKHVRLLVPEWLATCQAAGVPFFFKQWGEWAPDLMLESGRSDRSNSLQVSSGKLGEQMWMTRFGKKAAGRILDGREWSEYPS